MSVRIPSPFWLLIIQTIVSRAQQHMESLLQKLLEDCSVEQIEYYVSALGQLRQALTNAQKQGVLTQEEADRLLTKWLTE